MGSDGGGAGIQWADTLVNAGATFLAAVLAAGVAIWLARKERKAAEKQRTEERVTDLLLKVRAQAYTVEVAGEKAKLSEVLQMSGDLKALGRLIRPTKPKMAEYLTDWGTWFYESRRRRDQLEAELLSLGRRPTDEELRPLKAEGWDLGHAHSRLFDQLGRLYVDDVSADQLEVDHARVTENLTRLRKLAERTAKGGEGGDG